MTSRGGGLLARAVPSMRNAAAGQRVTANGEAVAGGGSGGVPLTAVIPDQLRTPKIPQVRNTL